MTRGGAIVITLIAMATAAEPTVAQTLRRGSLADSAGAYVWIDGSYKSVSLPTVVNFGIQEENHFRPEEVEAFPGTPLVERGFLYPSTRPGLGVDIDEKRAATLLSSTPGGRMNRYYPSDRKIDGSFVRP